MNIQQKKYTNLFESIDETANKLFESYKRTSNEREFLNENGDTVENRIIFAFMGLNEAVLSENGKFTFENGIYIPAPNKKLTGRLSLTSIAESAKDEDDFVERVAHDICESKLMFWPTESDVQNLKECYNNYINR